MTRAKRAAPIPSPASPFRSLCSMGVVISHEAIPTLRYIIYVYIHMFGKIFFVSVYEGCFVSILIVIPSVLMELCWLSGWISVVISIDCSIVISHWFLLKVSLCRQSKQFCIGSICHVCRFYISWFLSCKFHLKQNLLAFFAQVSYLVSRI